MPVLPRSATPFRGRPVRCALFAAGLLASTALPATETVAPPPVSVPRFTHPGAGQVFYFVLTDRFANGNPNNDYNVRTGSLARFQGGDWQGLIDHLDYIKELGVTTLWISPVVKNVETDADVDSYHGYWAQDLTQTAVAPSPWM